MRIELPMGEMNVPWNKLKPPTAIKLPTFYVDEVEDEYLACAYCGDVFHNRQCCSEYHFETVLVIDGEHYRAEDIYLEKGARPLSEEDLHLKDLENRGEEQ